MIKLFKKSILKLIKLNVAKRLMLAHLNNLKEVGFEFNGQRYEYFFHSYNNIFHTYISERSIEIPIIKAIIKQAKTENILEIGNVCQHYYDTFKTIDRKIVDKYEIAFDVINEDIIDFKDDNKFDLIYSISTFEHMDSDRGRNPEFASLAKGKYSSIAFHNLAYVAEHLLSQSGKIVLTFPLGYGECEIDQSIRKQEWREINLIASLTVYKRKGLSIWEQVPYTSVKNYTEAINQNYREVIVILELSRLQNASTNFSTK